MINMDEEEGQIIKLKRLQSKIQQETQLVVDRDHCLVFPPRMVDVII